jgi:broad specificity phosphatase PhoE
VRHGETQWSATGRHTGRTDIPLSEDGRHQAELVRRPLADRRFALVLSSPLSRALDTCRLAGLGDAVQLDDDLMEWDYGEYEGLTTEEITARRPGWWMWTDGYPGGEMPNDVAVRCDRVIRRCRGADGDVAVFAHGHVLRVFGARWINQPPAVGGSLKLSTAAISVLGWEHDVPAIGGWNDVSHLVVT